MGCNFTYEDNKIFNESIISINSNNNNNNNNVL